MPDRALASPAARDDRRDPCRAKISSEVVSIISPISQEPSQAPRETGQEFGCGLDVGGVPRREVDHRRATNDVGDDVDLRSLAASRDTDGLRLRPPLPPCAERCALM